MQPWRGTASTDRLLGIEELQQTYGGDSGPNLICDVDPRCALSCGLGGLEVDLCFGSTDDPGTCANEIESVRREALNQKRCLTPANKTYCMEGTVMQNDSCRVYAMCYWDSMFQACRHYVGYSPCFPFPSSCSWMQM
jgi:hypothetical protein